MADEAFLDVTLALLRSGCSVRFRPKGGSMRPTICSGELIEVEPGSPHDLQVGDIAFVLLSESIIVHRIVSATRDSSQKIFVTRGDACVNDDAPVSEAQVLGRVTKLQRDGKIIKFIGARARFAAFYYVRLVKLVNSAKHLLERQAPGLAEQLLRLRRLVRE